MWAYFQENIATLKATPIPLFEELLTFTASMGIFSRDYGMILVINFFDLGFATSHQGQLLSEQHTKEYERDDSHFP